MKWQEINKTIKTLIASGSLIGAFGVIWMITFLTGSEVSYTNWENCTNGTDCYARFEVEESYYRICFNIDESVTEPHYFKKVARSRTIWINTSPYGFVSTEPNIPTKLMMGTYKSKGIDQAPDGKWLRDIKTGDCIERKKTNYLYVKGEKQAEQEVEWKSDVFGIDPVWKGKVNKTKDLINKVEDEEFISNLRKTDIFREKNLLGNYKSYNSTKKRILIEDEKYNKLIELKLVSDYTTYVGSGNSTKVAEFLLVDYKKGIKLFDDLYFFNKNKDYSSQVREYDFKYGTDYIVEECYELLDFEELEYCQNVTKTNWTEFNSLSKLPHKNIKIGLFTNTKLGDKIEWIPTIQGFDILEWADWDVTSGTKHEFDTVNGYYNSLVQIDSTHYLNAYCGVDFDGYAVVLTVDTADWTVTSGTKHEFDTVDGTYHSLVQIDSTHYLNAYRGVNSDGFAVVLTVDTADWTVTSGTKHEFDTTGSIDNSLVQIDSTHYLNTYSQYGGDYDGYAVVLTVDTDAWTITSGTKHEFDTTDGTHHSLVQIDSTHYLNAYRGVNSDGFAVVLTVDTADWTITSGTKHEFDIVNSRYNSLVQIDSTHYLNAYAGSNYNGYAVVLTVDTADWTVTSGTKHEFDTVDGTYHSLVQIDSTHYLNAYCGVDFDGYAVVLTVDTADWTVTSGTKHEFDTVYGKYNSLVQIDSTHYLNAYYGELSDGFAVVLTVDVPAGAEDSCSNCDGTKDCYWDCSDECNITSNINMGGYNIEINQSTTGNHTITITGNVTNWGNLTTSGYDSSNICTIRCESQGGFK